MQLNESFLVLLLYSCVISSSLKQTQSFGSFYYNMESKVNKVVYDGILKTASTRTNVVTRPLDVAKPNYAKNRTPLPFS